MISLFCPNKDAEDGNCLREDSCETSNVFLINEHVHGRVCWRLLSFYLSMLKEEILNVQRLGMVSKTAGETLNNPTVLLKQPHTTAIIYISKIYLPNFIYYSRFFCCFDFILWLCLCTASKVKKTFLLISPLHV